ncbi:MAG: hypothetical protein O2904_01785 [bacterium]|nr:hypothetical protein [bacterium]
MLHTYSHPLLDLTNSALLVVGIVLMATGVSQTIQAKEAVPTVAQGSFVHQTHLDTVAVTLQPSTFHAAPYVPAVDMSLQLILGMVLVLLGCGIHAVLILQKETYSIMHKKKKKTSAKQWFEVFWI